MSVKQQGRELNPLKSRKNLAGAVALPSRSHQKPWPGRKINSDSELIKHMANLPDYLHGGKGRNEGDSQVRALDIGVMEWGLLEKWAYNQRRFGAGDSPSTSNSSMSLSSSSQSLQGTDSPLSMSKQSSPLSDGRKSASHDDDDDGDKDAIVPSVATSLKADDDDGESGADPKRRRPKHKKSLSFDFGNAKPPRLPNSVPRYIRSLSGRRPHLEDRKEFARHSFTGAIPPHEGISPIGKSDRPPLSSSSSRGSDGAGMRIGGQRDRIKKFTEISSKLIKQYLTDDEVELGEDSGVNPTKGIELLGSHFGATRQKWPGSRSSVSRNHLPTTTDGVQADRDARNSTRRRSSSPLRKMIEPFLRSKDRRRLLGSDTRPRNNPKSSSSREGSVSSNDESMEDYCFSSVEDCFGSTRQALLQLAWKQEAPLIIFSADGGSDVILVASIKKEEDFRRECNAKIVYAISMVPESAKKKKAGGSWSHGSKSRKHGFLSTPTIAQLRVSSSDSVVSSSCISKRKRVFVLLGDELEPSLTESSSSFKHELAAILVTMSRGGYPSELLLESDVMTSSQGGNMVAIVPRGIHGSSEDTGMPPPPLIQRWQSSSSCDCGGWDEGCSLTVLSDTNEGPPSSSAPLSPLDDGSAFRTDLFPKGGGSQDGFSLVALNKEGLYTVEFARPISSLQAFGICIAAFHGRRGPLRQTSMPDNPPPSPVGVARPAF